MTSSLLTRSPAARTLFSTALALASGLAVSAVVVALAGASPAVAFAALLRGAFGSGDGLSEVAVKGCPLILCGLAVAVAFQAGIWNIGAEGQLLLGALAVAWLGPRTEAVPAAIMVPVLLLFAAAAGAAWAAI